VEIIGVVASVHDIALRGVEIVTLSEEFPGMTDIMDPTVRSHEPGNDLKVSINRDRCFQELFSEFPGTFRKIVSDYNTRW